LVPEPLMKCNKYKYASNSIVFLLIVFLFLQTLCSYGLELGPRGEKLIEVVKHPIDYDALTQRRAVMELSAMERINAASRKSLIDYLFGTMKPANPACMLWIAEALSKVKTPPYESLINTYRSYQYEVMDMDTTFEESKQRLGRMLRETKRFDDNDAELIQKAYVKHFKTIFYNLSDINHLNKDEFSKALNHSQEDFLKDIRNEGKFEPADTLSILRVLISVWEPIFARLDQVYGGQQFDPYLNNVLVVLSYMGKKAESSKDFLLEELQENTGTDIEWSIRVALVNIDHKPAENRRLLLKEIKNRSKNVDGAVELLGKGCLSGFETTESVEALIRYLGNPYENEATESTSAAIALSNLLDKTAEHSTQAVDILRKYWNKHDDSSRIVYGLCLARIDSDNRKRILMETLRYISSRAGIVLNDTDWYMMDKAIFALDSDTINELGKLLESDDDDLVIGAILILSRCGLEAQKYSPKIIQLLENRTHPTSRNHETKDKGKNITEIDNIRKILKALTSDIGSGTESPLPDVEFLMAELSTLFTGSELRLKSAAALSLATMGIVEDVNKLKQLLKRLKSNDSVGETIVSLFLSRSISTLQLKTTSEEDVVPF